MDTGWPIVYTSADSVFQIAAHEDVIPWPSSMTFVLRPGDIAGEHGVAGCAVPSQVRWGPLCARGTGGIFPKTTPEDYP